MASNTPPEKNQQISECLSDHGAQTPEAKKAADGHKCPNIDPEIMNDLMKGFPAIYFE